MASTIEYQNMQYDYLLQNNKENLLPSQLESVLRMDPGKSELFAEFKKRNPKYDFFHRMDSTWNSLQLLSKALRNAYLQLVQVRTEGIGTHAHGHAVASLFRKVMDLLEAELHEFHRGMKSVSDIFYDIAMGRCESIRTVFEPIEKVLSASVRFNNRDSDQNIAPEIESQIYDKRAKQTLLRAFFPAFDDEYNRFAQIDWQLEFQAFYLACLNHYHLTIE